MNTDETDNNVIDIENISRIANRGDERPPSTVNSIPIRLRSCYGHSSCKAINLALLSFFIVGGAFTAMFLEKFSPCETIGISTTVLALYAPSPLGKN